MRGAIIRFVYQLWPKKKLRQRQTRLFLLLIALIVVPAAAAAYSAATQSKPSSQIKLTRQLDDLHSIAAEGVILAHQKQNNRTHETYDSLYFSDLQKSSTKAAKQLSKGATDYSAVSTAYEKTLKAANQLSSTLQAADETEPGQLRERLLNLGNQFEQIEAEL